VRNDIFDFDMKQFGEIMKANSILALCVSTLIVLVLN